MLSCCRTMLSISLGLCCLFFGLAHAAADDKTRIGNSTIERVSFFLLCLCCGKLRSYKDRRIGRKVKALKEDVEGVYESTGCETVALEDYSPRICLHFIQQKSLPRALVEKQILTDALSRPFNSEHIHYMHHTLIKTSKIGGGILVQMHT